MSAPARLRAAIAAAVILAIGMGFGRFAFTAIYPHMVTEGVLSLRDGSLAASANYAGYLLGADEYVTKPCTPRELTARIRAILRRSQAAPHDSSGLAPLAVGQLTMWPEQRRVAWAGAHLELTSTEFNLLEVLVRHAGKPVSKNQLSELGLGRPMARFDRNIDVHLSSLRRKLGSLADGRSCLQTVYRLGYQLIKE